MLVDNRKAMPGLGITQHDIATAIERADRIALSVVEIIVEANAGRRNFLYQGGFDVPVIVEIFRNVELETGRSGMNHGAARKHMIDVLADPHGVGDVQKIKRVLVRNKDEIRMTHDASTAVKSNWRPAGA